MESSRIGFIPKQGKTIGLHSHPMSLLTHEIRVHHVSHLKCEPILGSFNDTKGPDSVRPISLPPPVRRFLVPEEQKLFPNLFWDRRTVLAQMPDCHLLCRLVDSIQLFKLYRMEAIT